MTARSVEQVVKLQVKIGGLLFGNPDVDLSDHAVDNVLHLIQVNMGRIANDVLYRHLLQTQAQTVDLIEVFPRQPGDNRPAIARDDDQPFALKLLQGFADWPPADPKRL